MEEIKITPEESDMLLHGREHKPGEEGELTDTGERITFPMSEAALSSIEEGRRLAAEHEAERAAENVSNLDTPGGKAKRPRLPVWGPKPELTVEFIEIPSRYAALKRRIDEIRDLYGQEYDIKIKVSDATIQMEGMNILQGLQ